MRYLFLLIFLIFFACSQKEESIIYRNTVLNDTGKIYNYPNGLTVSKGAILQINSGVTLAIGEKQNIIVYGTLIIEGSVNKAVKISPKDTLWGRIVFKAGSKNNKLEFLNIIDGAIGIENAPLYLSHINIFLNKKRETQVAWPVIYSKLGNVEIRNSYIYNKSNGWVGEGIVALGGKMNIYHSAINNIPDAIEYTQVNNSTISNIHVKNSGDDGIDLNSCNNINIVNSILEDISDKGVTIGGAYKFTEIIKSLPITPSNNILVSNCLIKHTKIGIGIKDGSILLMDSSLILDSKTGIQIEEKNPGQGSGTILVKNSTIFNYQTLITFVRNQSVFNFANVKTNSIEPLINQGDTIESISLPSELLQTFSYREFLNINENSK